MRIEIVMPRLSDSMAEGSVTAWFKNEGDTVAEGEAIAELETEKSTVDLTSPGSGVLGRIIVVAGSGNVAVGTVLAEIETDASAAAGAMKSGASAPVAGAAKGEADAPAAPVGGPAGANVPANASGTMNAGDAASVLANENTSGDAASPRMAPSRSAAALGKAASSRQRSDAPTLASVGKPPIPAADQDASIAATPLARRMAAQAGLSLASLTRSGIGGKVCKADVEAALGRTAPLAVVSSRAASSVLASRGAAASASRTSAPAGANAAPAAGGRPSSIGPARGDSAAPAPMSRVRRTIAERMARAKATIPHFYLSVDCRVDRLLDVREGLKADGLAISVNDFVVRASAIALARVPQANASWVEGEGIVLHDRVDIAVAVALDDGLVTPVVRAVNTLGLAAIGETVRDLAARARDGNLAPHEYDGATFTISNLGMHGVGAMFAIINPPQACILGVGAAEARPVVEDGKVVAGTVMTLSLSADHRILDGTTGAKLLAEIRRLLEEPARMLA